MTYLVSVETVRIRSRLTDSLRKHIEDFADALVFGEENWGYSPDMDTNYLLIRFAEYLDNRIDTYKASEERGDQ